MSEPYISKMKPAEFSRVRMALQRKGVSGPAVSEFLAGNPVSNSSDRLKLAAILIEHETARTGLSPIAPQPTSQVRKP
jgi:hypothetical protein